ncbi:MAG: alpha/beta hydrolase [Dermatophilus congolensis]|nr:alpha/beta hydrolase [Dermatophilus congolensis]
MNPALSGLVGPSWMSRDPEEIAWLAWAIRDKRDRLDAAMTRAAVALAGASASDTPAADGLTRVVGEATSPEPAALRSALTSTADALDDLAAALSEHGVAIGRDRAELAATPPHQLARIASLRHRIRVATDALAEADVRCRRKLEEAVLEVPSASGVASAGRGGWAAVFGVTGLAREAAPGSDGETAEAKGAAAHGNPTESQGEVRGLGSLKRALRPDRSPREALRTLPTATLARNIVASPELRVRLAEDLPKLGEEPAVDLTNLAEAAGVDPQICHAAAQVVRRRAPSLSDQAALGDDGDRVRAAEIASIVEAFAQLGDDAAHRMALLWPRLVGSLDGAPVFARAVANRTLLRAELESARRSEAELEARSLARRVADEPFVVRRIRAAASAAYARRDWLTSLVAVRVDEPLLVRDDLRTRIRLYLRLLTERVEWPGGGENARPEPRALLSFDPSGRGRVVEVMGRYDDDTENLAVIVPGTGTGMPGYHMPAGTARDVVGADTSGRTVAVCWMGVDFPSAIVNEAILGHYAKVAGPALTASVLALDVPPHVTTTVVGHSYGSAVVGSAEVAGLPADRVVHLASPGAGPGVRGVADYATRDPLGRIRSVRRYACTAAGDPIRLVQATPVGWPLVLRHFAAPATWVRNRLEDFGLDLAAFDAIGLGVDPARLEGVTVYDAGVWEVDTDRHRAGEPVAGRSGHAGVITSGTTAFRRMVGIVTGGEPQVR